MNDVRERIVEYLKQQKLTQREAAARLGITEAYLSRLLHGHTPITKAFRAAFADAFGFDAALAVFYLQRPEQPEEQERLV